MNMENLKFRLRLIVRQILRLRVRLRRVHKATILDMWTNVVPRV